MRLFTVPAALLALLAFSAAPVHADGEGHDSEAAPVFGVALADSQLRELRGGTDTTTSNLQLTGTTASNTAYQMSTGDNAISSGAFSGLSGIPMVIQNTGANVLIQNAMILNLQIN